MTLLNVNKDRKWKLPSSINQKNALKQTNNGSLRSTTMQTLRLKTLFSRSIPSDINKHNLGCQGEITSTPTRNRSRYKKVQIG